MKNERRVLVIAFLVFSYTSFSQIVKVSRNEFSLFLGNWKGNLTYLDYSSNTPYTMPADVSVKRIKLTNKFVFSNIYPDEPKANSNDTFVISKKGTAINQEIIKSKRFLENGNIEIVTEYLGADGNEDKSATIRHIYTIEKKFFLKRKDIQFLGQTEWIKRHEYSYKRIGT